jgi:PTS system galactitol-specific IIC component
MELTGFFGTLANLPQLGIIPVVVFVLALIVRQPIKKAIEGGIKVGIGGLGMLAMSYFTINYFGPAVLAAAENMGGPVSRLTLVDVGWTNALMVLANPMIWVNILIFVAINLIMIRIGIAKTLYVDFPCMWRGVWTGMIVWYVTGSYWWGTLGMIIFLITDVLLADWNAKRLQTFHEFNPTASFPNSQNAAIIAAPLAWILAHIPGLKNWNFKGDWVRKNLGFFAQPMVLGMITGSVLGIMAGFKVLEILLVGVVAAMMFHVWPMALGVMFDGWSAFNEGMRNNLVKRMKEKGREVYLAVDTSVLLGHPTVGVSTTLMYPIAFLMAIFVPGVGLFPVISVQIIQWWMAHITGWTKGNIIHNLIICAVVVLLYGWAATAMAEPYTAWAAHYGIISQDMLDAGIQVTNWDGGGDLRIYLIYLLSRLLPSAG